MQSRKNIQVIISGGGTGGHVFPAIAIAQALKSLKPDINIRFVGAIGRLEMEKVPKAGYEIDGLWIDGFKRKKILANLLLPFKLFSSLFKSFLLIRKYRPDLGIGVGGYASGPFLKVATSMGVPVLLQEANAFPGMTNKLLANGADKICVAYDGMEQFFDTSKIILTGNPVRSSFSDIDKIEKSEAFDHFSLKSDKPVVFVTGGSGGAKPMNEAVVENYEAYIKAGIQIIWQCGKVYLEKYRKYNSPEKGIIVLDFIDRMDYAYAISDLIVSRAGALSIAEQQTVGKAVILVPSPYVTEDHQTKNAEALVAVNAARMIKDKELSSKLFNTINELIQDSDERNLLKENMKSLASDNAAERIAKEALLLIENE